jgi:WD40 repeat protein
MGVPPGGTAETDLSWLDASGLGDLSDDGRLILMSDRRGIYVRRTDGSPPTFLGHRGGFGDDFSPDGQRVLLTAAGGRELVVMPASLGEPQPVPAHGLFGYRGSLWFPDGRRILVSGIKPGSALRSYVQDLEGGPPVALTRENVWGTAISGDGQWVAAIGSGEGISLWPVAGGSPRDVPSRPGDRPIAWSGDGRSLWVFRRGEVPAEVLKVDVATGRRSLWKKLEPPDPAGVYSITDFRVTPDGQVYFYSFKRQVSQLYVASGLR